MLYINCTFAGADPLSSPYLMSGHVARALEAVHRLGQKEYGFWGNHTATIDWCEDNYTHTQYIAEWYNTVSNIPFIALGLYGAYYSLREIPSAMHRWRFTAPHIGIACVGVGSFIFHATLNWYAQVLLDEMPMIYVSSMVLYLVFAPTDGPGSLKLKVGIASIPLTVTALYLRFSYPVIHQLCFAGIMLSIGYRFVGLIRGSKHNPEAISDAKYYIFTGAFMFILAFGIWNIDNAFCDFWTLVRTSLWNGEPGPSFKTPSLPAAIVGAVTQGHAWWHILTGLGCARMAAGASYLMLTTSHPDILPPAREPNPPLPLSPPAPTRKASDDAIFRPYKDDPVSYEDEGPSHDEILLQQRQMIDEQDTHLDRLSNSIRNQRDISLQINDELEVHTGLLEALDHELDSTGDRLSRARRRLDHVARGAKDNGSAVAIGVLIFVLLILIIVFKT
ncbi:unnamed protein product [Rhizoctonia solani]|uniref:t-SNARE coiled-coil homology domain-containing protein n=1 Tax=Rhizoctonia solani TaxID=456999 RepID=A0A8H3ACA1_9AGAM|nr:unnamed protein product [Rhizoctonia solani]